MKDIKLPRPLGPRQRGDEFSQEKERLLFTKLAGAGIFIPLLGGQRHLFT